MVQSSHSCPVVVSQDGQPRRIELFLARHDPEEVREALLREHRMRVGVSQLTEVDYDNVVILKG